MPPLGHDPLRALAFAARDGDTRALERVVAAIQDDIYRLALRMVWHPEDAKDAAQEALVRIVTRIASFRGDAAFRTWAYRVAAKPHPQLAPEHGDAQWSSRPSPNAGSGTRRRCRTPPTSASAAAGNHEALPLLLTMTSAFRRAVSRPLLVDSQVQ